MGTSIWIIIFWVAITGGTRTAHSSPIVEMWLLSEMKLQSKDMMLLEYTLMRGISGKPV